MSSERTRSAEVAADLERRIRGDEWRPHERLPTLAALTEEYGASPSTVTTALKSLARKGLLTLVRSYGTVVLDWRRPRQVRRQRAVYRDDRGYYFDQIAKAWQPTAPSVISWVTASDHLAELLGIPDGSEVLVRERTVGEEISLRPGTTHINVQQLASTVVPADIARPLDLGRRDTGPDGVLGRLEEAYGTLTFEDVTYARFPTREEAAALQLGSGDAPILGIAVVISDSSGRILAVNDYRMDGRRWMVGHALGRAGGPTEPDAEQQDVSE